MRKKILAIITIALCLVSMAVPCFAYTSNDTEGQSEIGTWYSSVVPWDTFVFYNAGTDFAVPFPYSCVGDTADTGFSFPQVWVDIESAELNPDYIITCTNWMGDYLPSKDMVGIQFDTYTMRNDGTTLRPSTMAAHYGLRSGTPFFTDPVGVFALLNKSSFQLPAGASCRYVINVDLIAPAEGYGSNASVLYQYEYSYESSFVNTASAPVTMIMFPSPDKLFGDDLTFLSGRACVIYGISWDLFIDYPELNNDPFYFTLPYIWDVGFPSPIYSFGDYLSNMWESYPNIRYEYVNADADFTSWISNALGGFWDAEFFPGFTFGGVAAVLIGVGCLSFLIKWWLGG